MNKGLVSIYILICKPIIRRRRGYIIIGYMCMRFETGFITCIAVIVHTSVLTRKLS